MGGGAASGAVGSHVASHNTGGQYVRARTTPTNPNTTFQQDVRNAVRTLTTQWNTLSVDDRESWQVYAANVTFRNRLGDTIKISGIANFVRSNVPRFQAGLATITTAPPVFDLGDVSSSVAEFDFGATQGTLTIDPTSAWLTSLPTTGNTLMVWLSRPQNAGINFFKGPFRYAGNVSSTQGLTGTAVITLPFTSDPATSQQIFGQCRVTRGDGRLSSAFQFSGTN